MKRIRLYAFRVLALINGLYSVAWIKLHQSDKWEYRERSKVNHALMQCAWVMRP